MFSQALETFLRFRAWLHGPQAQTKLMVLLRPRPFDEDRSVQTTSFQVRGATGFNNIAGMVLVAGLFAYFILAFAWVTSVAGFSPAGLVGLLLTLLSIYLVCFARQDPIPVWLTVIICLSIIVASGGYIHAFLTSANSPGFYYVHDLPDWLANGAMVPLIVLSARGRVVASMITGGIILAAVWFYYFRALDQPAAFSIFMAGVLAPLILSAFYRYFFAPLEKELVGLYDAQTKARIEKIGMEATLMAHHNQLHWVNTHAGELLHKMADGEEFTDQQRQDALVIEARLRDHLRAEGLACPTVENVAVKVREGGTIVKLLDDGALRDHPELLKTAQLLTAEVLSECVGKNYKKVVGRIMPPDRTHVLSVLIVGGDTYFFTKDQLCDKTITNIR